MQRPVMDPTFFRDEEVAAAAKRQRIGWRAIPRAMWRVARFAWRVLTVSPFRRQAQREYRIEDGTATHRFVRGFLYRMAFAPVVLTMLVAALVFAGTHPKVKPPTVDP